MRAQKAPFLVVFWWSEHPLGLRARALGFLFGGLLVERAPVLLLIYRVSNKNQMIAIIPLTYTFLVDT